jgi:hypothetical protein
MGQVLVRNIESYKLKAKIKGISLEQELRNLLEANKPFTPEERVAFAREIRARTKGVAPSLTLEEIREGLE